LGNDTLSGNTAGLAGVGIFNAGTFATPVSNSIFDDANSCAGTAGFTDVGHNVESDNSCGFSTANGSIVNSSTINLSSSLAANGSTGPETLALADPSSAIDVAPVA